MNISPINQNLLSPSSGGFHGPSLGRLLQEMGKITPEDTERILQLQRKEGLRFGDAAMKLRLVTEADIQRTLSIQFDYPHLPDGMGKGLSRELVAAYQPFSPEAEALRTLRSQLILQWFGNGHKMLAVIGTHSDDGCSALSANLAVVFSQMGENTLLIDANLRQPAQHDLFSLGEQHGLANMLIGRVGLEAVNRIDSLANLCVLGAGAVPPNPQELLSRRSFGELMHKLQALHDVIIVDVAPWLGTADAQLVAMRCGGALLVSRLDVTPLRDLIAMRDQLLASDVRIVAGVAQ